MRSLAPLVVPCLLGVGCHAAVPARPNVLVIDADSVRADRLRTRHGDRDVMPNVRALMARGVTFENAFAQSGWTVPALAALLTGRHPVAIDVGAPATAVLPPGARLVSEVLGLYGYHATVLWGRGVEAGFTDFSRGFSTRLTRPGSLGQAPDDLAPLDAWLRDPAAPFFLLVHDFDAHVPGPWFTAAHEHAFGDDGYTCTGGAYHETYQALAPTVGAEAAMAHAMSHYDGVLHGYDALIGRLLARLEAAHRLDDTIVVFTSNHGEDFGEHGPGIKHGGLYDVTLRVPLVVAGPGIGPGGSVVTTPVQGIDLAPTLLALAGVPADHAMQGVSFAPLLHGLPADPAAAERPVFSLSNARNLSVRTATRKLLLTDDASWQAEPGAPTLPTEYRYYDLAADPGERSDLYPAHPEAAADLVALLTTFAADRAQARVAAEDVPVDAALREAVREKGYWEVAGSASGVPAAPAAPGPAAPVIPGAR